MNRVDPWWLTSEEESIDLDQLPPDQVSFVFDSVKSGLCFADPRPYFELVVNENLKHEYFDVELSDKFNHYCCIDGPRPREWVNDDVGGHRAAGLQVG
jgi:hypothetical protein